MSLKAFHLFFIALSIACAFGFSVWCAELYRTQTDPDQIVMGVLSFLGGAVLCVYGFKVRKKLKNMRLP